MRIQLEFASTLALVIIAVAQSAHAVEYQFSGSVIDGNKEEECSDPLGFEFIIGQAISGELNYNLDAAGTVVGTGPNGIPILTSYSSPRINLKFTINGVTFAGRASILVGNDGLVGSSVELEVDSFNAIGSMQSSGPCPFTVFLMLEDTTETAFSNTALPVTVPASSFDLRSIEMVQTLSDGSVNRFIEASVRKFTRIGREFVLDMRPGNAFNRIDPESGARVPVAILSSIDPPGLFDTATINPLSVRFGGVGREIAPLRFQRTDVDADGDLDLLFQFRSRDIGLGCTDVTATLRGETFGGNVVQGTDAVEVLGCNDST